MCPMCETKNKKDMRCIIVDDEPLAREGLELKVQKTGFLELVGMFSGGLSANQFLAENAVDLIFLDIQMPDLTGLELLRTLKNPPLVIFTTAFSEYALEGFELDVVDYLLKPIDFQRFMKATNKAREIWEQSHPKKANVVEIPSEFIYVRADRQFIKVFFKDIRYIEGMKNYAMVHTINEKLMTAISLQQILEQLPDTQFARINKSYIINVNYIQRILPDFILLDKKTELPFGNAFQEAFIEKFVKGNLLERK
jgi:two-component system, LytTR family, response regulator